MKKVVSSIMSSSVMTTLTESETDTSQTNLIVNYLPQQMSQDEVLSLFTTIGPVQSCKLVRDRMTGQSLAYAFVNFVKASDAGRAIQNLSGLPLQGKVMKVSYARPSSNMIKNANLYISELPPSFTQHDLEELFSPYGHIITSRVVTDQATGMGKGIAFVRFDQNTQAQAAIDSVNGSTPPGCSKPLTVKFANPPRQTAAGPSIVPGRISMPGAQGSAISTISPQQRQPRGLAQGGGGAGPIRHSQANHRYNPMGDYGARAPANLMTPHAYPAMPGAVQPTANGWCIFVYNIPMDCQESLLYQLFGPFGAITQVKVIREPSTQKCKGYGFVNMVNYEDAFNAVLSLNGYNLMGKALQVSFKTNKS